MPVLTASSRSIKRYIVRVFLLLSILRQQLHYCVGCVCHPPLSTSGRLRERREVRGPSTLEPLRNRKGDLNLGYSVWRIPTVWSSSFSVVQRQTGTWTRVTNLGWTQVPTPLSTMNSRKDGGTLWHPMACGFVFLSQSPCSLSNGRQLVTHCC